MFLTIATHEYQTDDDKHDKDRHIVNLNCNYVDL